MFHVDPSIETLLCLLHSCLPQEATKHTTGSAPSGPRFSDRPFSELDDFWTPCKLENLTITERPAHPEIQRFWIPSVLLEGVTHYGAENKDHHPGFVIEICTPIPPFDCDGPVGVWTCFDSFVSHTRPPSVCCVVRLVSLPSLTDSPSKLIKPQPLRGHQTKTFCPSNHLNDQVKFMPSSSRPSRIEFSMTAPTPNHRLSPGLLTCIA